MRLWCWGSEVMAIEFCWGTAFIKIPNNKETNEEFVKLR
jgi:hypothetical protein